MNDLCRAGLFIVGNMANMVEADEQSVWRPVREELVAQGALGAALPLRCEVHGTLAAAASAADFRAKSPQGGCTRLCGVLMACGHVCKQVCHVQDREHQKVR